MADAYCTKEDLENALGRALVTAVYDDDNDGQAETSAINACLEYATAECNSFLRGTYATPITPIPPELKFAAIDFACAYTARRRPELAHTLGSEPFKMFYEAARAKMKRFDESEQRLDGAAGTPTNIGGYVSTPLLGGGAVAADGDIVDGRGDGWGPARTFDDMGDF